MRKLIFIALFVGTILSVAGVSTVQAAQTTPYILNFQGRLVDTSGNPMPDGQYNIRFRLMSQLSGGTNLWQADRMYTGAGTDDHRVTVANGVFTVRLGDTAVGVGDPALTTGLFNTQTNSSVYVEIELPTPATATSTSPTWTEGPLSPRSLITATAHAMNADTIDGIDATSLVQLGANNTLTGDTTFSGSFVYQPASDSTTAFQIQKSDGTPLLVADTTSNFALKVGGGDVSTDASPALLVLDYKNTTGDPTGTNGAMYYNSANGKFRCKESDVWTDCLQAARTRFEYHNDFIFGSPINNGTGIDGTIAASTANGGVFSRQNGETNRPGIVRFDTGSSSASGFAGMSSTIDASNANNPILFGAGTWMFTSAVRVTTLSSSTQRFTLYTGLLDNQNAFTTTPGPHNGCYLKYSDNINDPGSGARWQGVCRNGDNETNSTCDTGVQVATGTWYELKLIVNSTGTSVIFAVTDGGTGVTSTCTPPSPNIPTTNPVAVAVDLLKSVGAGSRTVDFDYMEVLGTELVRN